MAEALAAAVAGRGDAVALGASGGRRGRRSGVPPRSPASSASACPRRRSRRSPTRPAGGRRRRRSAGAGRPARRACRRRRWRPSGRGRPRGRGRSSRGRGRRRSRRRPPPASSPAGAGPASSRVSALRAACSAIAAGSPSKSSKPRWPPSVSAPVSTTSPRRATAWAPIRTRVRSSPAEQALRVGDRDLAAGLGVGGDELGDLAARAAARSSSSRSSAALRSAGTVGGRLLDRHAARLGDRPQRSRLGALAAQRRGGLAGGALEVGRVEPVDVGEVGRAAARSPGRPRPPRRRTAPTRSATRRSPWSGRRARSAKTSANSPPLASARAETRSATARFEQLAHRFGRFPATSIRRPAATKSSRAGGRVGGVVARCARSG